MSVNISKQPKVNLTKGQSVNLTKDGTSSTEKLNKVFFGAKWGSIVHKGFLNKLFGGGTTESVDLDASLLMYNKSKVLVDTVYFGNKISKDRSICHSGDDLTGTAGSEGDSDNETISINLSNVAPSVEYIVAILNSYRHHKFDEIPYMKLRIYTGEAGHPDEVLCAYNLENNQSFKGKEAIVLGYFYRTKDGWKFKADGTTSNEPGISAIARGSALEVLA